MKKYFFPKIKVVELAPEQAVLQVCKSEGQYFYTMTTLLGCVYGGTINGNYTCVRTIRGQGPTVASGTFFDETAEPS